MTGSWITHTTTARISDNYSAQQAQKFAQSLPNNGVALNGGLPDELFNPEFKTLAGPISDSVNNNTSPAAYLFEPAKPALITKSYRVRRGDTLGNIFKKQDLDLNLPHQISNHDTAKQLVSLSVNKELVFGYNQKNEFKQLEYPLNSLQKLVVDFDNGQLTEATIVDLPFEIVQKTVSAEITTSLYEAALEAGLSINMVMEMVRIFGWDIDFVLDIRGGDNFHVMYEENHFDGQKLSDGALIAARFTTQNNTFHAFRFEDGENGHSYFNEKGESMLGTFLRSPVEFSRISSRFGKRKHPILKTWRAHKGVDYAAGRGTPIRATADGKVIHAGNKGGYGKTVVLRHAGRFSTLYAHMNGYAKGVRSGSRVKQGDVIGYIGSTGLATGPHLHYEFRLDGVHRNPLSFKTPKASAVAPHLMDKFSGHTSIAMAKLESMANKYQLAKQGTIAITEAH